MRARLLLVLAVLLAATASIPAHADGSDCTVLGASSDSPHLADPPGDWDGIVTGTTNGPFGDVSQQSADILGLWFTTDGAVKPKYAVHELLGSLNDPTKGLEVNESIYIYFNNPRSKIKDADGNAVTDVYVSADFNGRGAASFAYGYVAPDPTTGVNNINQIGGATGKYIAGSPGQIEITLPSAMGQLMPGDLIGTPSAESRFLIGAAGTGLNFPTDTTANAEGCVDGVIA